MHRKFLERYAPPSAIVDADYNIVHLSEHAGRYILHGGGELSRNLLKVVLPELRTELRTALFQASQSRRSTEARRVRLEREGREHFVNMVAHPVIDEESGTKYILVLFAEVEEVLGTEGKEGTSAEAAPLVFGLEAENRGLKEQLQVSAEHYETALEELKAANEELQATVEELRSTTEEHETSKEELQSVNEELKTVNEELKHKIEELGATNDDLNNLMSATEIATIFLDDSLRIKRYTPRVLDLFNLIQADEGRELATFTHKLEYEELVADARRVLDTLQRVEREVRSRAGGTYLARLLPYRTTNNRIEGVILNFLDISERKRAEEELRQSEERLRLMMESVTDYAIFITDTDGRIERWNLGAERMFGYTEAEAVGQACDIIFTPEDRAAGAPEEERQQAHKHGRASDDRWHLRKDGSRFYVSGVMTPLYHGSMLTGYTKIARDLTERKRLDEELLSARAQLEDRVLERTRELSEANTELRAEITRRKEAEAERQRLLGRIVGVQEEERRRLSRELHDSLGQQLTALRLGIENFLESGGRTSEDVVDLRGIIRRLDEEVDFLSLELRPTSLDDLGLAAALNSFVRDWSRQFNIAVEYHVTGLADDRLPPEFETNLYRVPLPRGEERKPEA